MGFFGRRMVPEPLIKDLSKKRYIHVLQVNLQDNNNFFITVPSDSKKLLTSDDLRAFISSLPDGAVYPVTQAQMFFLGSGETKTMNFIYGITNFNGTNRVVGTTVDFLNGSTTSFYKNMFMDYFIVNQFVL